LVGVTSGGGLVAGGPELATRPLLPDGWGGVGTPFFDPSGGTVAIASGSGLWAVDVATGRARIVRAAPTGSAPPVIAGWSRDGTWIGFWRDVGGATPSNPVQAALEVVRASGGSAREIEPRMTAAAGSLSWCERELVLVGGQDAAAPSGRLLDSAPPAWSTTELSQRIPSPVDATWPACASQKRLVAVSIDLGSAAQGPAIWLIQPHGFTGPATIPGVGFSDEAAQWSADGRLLLFVRRSLTTGDGMLFVLAVGQDGRPGALTGPLGDLGSDASSPWTERFSWYGGEVAP